MITQKELKEFVSYDKGTGLFTAIKNSYNNVRRKGDICGSVNANVRYVDISVNGKSYLAHRLVFLYVNGTMPINEIDHINHNTKDNRLVNLRVVVHAKNQRNRKLFKNNKSGVVGVSYCKANKKWYASIQANYKSINLGYFKDVKNAIKARKKAEIKYGFHKNHGNSSQGRRIVPLALSDV